MMAELDAKNSENIILLDQSVKELEKFKLERKTTDITDEVLLTQKQALEDLENLNKTLTFNNFFWCLDDGVKVLPRSNISRALSWLSKSALKLNFHEHGVDLRSVE